MEGLVRTPNFKWVSDEGSSLLDRVGPELVKKLVERRSARRALAYIEGSLKDDSYVPAAAD